MRCSMTWGRRILIGSTMSLLLAGPGGAADAKPAAPASARTAAKRAPARSGWPDTRAGAVGRKWVEAFASGEAAMRAFYANEMSAETLAQRSMSDRIEKYREFRDDYGTLELFAVVKSTPTELTVSLVDADAKRHEFVFVLTAAAPHTLRSIRMKQRSHGHGFGGFHH